MDDLTEIIVGVITRAHGVRGEVVVDLRTDEPERRFAAGQVLRLDNPRPGSTVTSLTVERTREHQGRRLVTFAEVGDRTIAETLRGVRLLADVPADEGPEADDEFYDRQLVGLSVFTAAADPDGDPVGTVRGVLHLPAQDVLEISTADGVRMVPFVSELVPAVDLENGRITVADIAGLLDDEAEIAGEQA